MASRKNFDDSKYYEEDGYSKPKRKKKTFRKKEKYKKSYLEDLDDYNYYETKGNRRTG